MILGPLMIAAALAAGLPVPAPPPRRGYLQASLLDSYQPPDSATYHRESPNLRGTVPAVSVTVGGFLLPSLGLEGEFYYGGTVSRAQRFSYFSAEDYTAGSQDMLIEQHVRYRPGGRAPVEIVVGGGYARTVISERSIVVTSSFSPQASALPDRSHRYSRFSVTGGLDGVIPLSARVALTPSFRFRWIGRPDVMTGESHGIGNYAFQFGAGLRFW